MAESTENFLPKPRNWQEFESICFSLWKKKWGDINATKNGRQGQPQCGVDVSGQMHGKGDFHGVQCKGKDDSLDSFVTLEEIKKEVEKAKNFKPGLASFTLATTAPNDAFLSEAVRVFSKENVDNGSFPVYLRAWDDLTNDLHDYPDVIEKHFSQFASTIRKIEANSAKMSDEMVNTTVAMNKVVTLLENQAAVADDSTIDKHLNQQIDDCNELLKNGRANLALQQLTTLENSDLYRSAHNNTRFRIRHNIGSCHLSLDDFPLAARFFKEAYTFDPESIKAKAAYAYSFPVSPLTLKK